MDIELLFLSAIEEYIFQTDDANDIISRFSVDR